MRALILTLLIAFFWIPLARAADTPIDVYIGSPKLEKSLETDFWYLTNSGELQDLIGSAKDVNAKNPALASCLAAAAKQEGQTRIVGNLDPGRGSIDIAKLVCEPIKSQKDCPRKILGQKTVTGVYMGTVCGDFCYLSLHLGGGKDFSPFADPDEVEKLFGEQPGKRVSVTVDVAQGWMPENIEIPEGPGFCVIAEEFKSGEVLN